MTVRVSKPEFNLREKLSELDKPSGLKGNELLKSETSQEARGLIGAGRKNLIINGAMQISQRGTSTTTLGYLIDRFLSGAANINNPTYAQVDVASGTEPYAAGFRKAAKYTGAANAVHSNDVLKFNQKIEAQNIARSGWDHKSGSSFITLSFWVKSSVGQTFFGRLQSVDGTNQNYPFSYDVSANIWTKVVKTIPGNSNITIDNDNGFGLDLEWTLYRGVDTTASSTVVNQWQTYAPSARLPDGVPSGWHDTTSATWEITGIQLEVGQNATEFEHRPYTEELTLCERYYEVHWQNTNTNNPAGSHNDGYNAISAGGVSGSKAYFPFKYRTQKRASPTLEYSGKFRISGGSGGSGTNKTPDEFYSPSIDGGRLRFPQSGGSNGDGMWLEFDGGNSSNGYIAIEAEL